uniref:Uncharacterized protein n=1 Tax=Romanomermis culicivorax TaxID=13658 RepID=A0A915JMA8_ROMCU
MSAKQIYAKREISLKAWAPKYLEMATKILTNTYIYILDAFTNIYKLNIEENGYFALAYLAPPGALQRLYTKPKK